MLGLGLGLSRLSSIFGGIIRKGLQLWLGFTKAEVIGKELVVDGSFANGLNDWTSYGTISSVGGVATIGASANSGIYQSILTQGLNYSVTINVDSWDGVGVAEVVNGDGANLHIITSIGENTFTFTSTIASGDFIIRGTSNALFSISNVIVKEVAQFIPDKSTNTNNAKLFTGKALEFNGNDSVDIDFGDPNINLKSICFWIKLDATNTTEQIANLTSTHNITSVSGTITLNGTWSNANIYVNGVDTDAIGTTYKRVVITTDTNILVDEFDLAKIDSDYGLITIADIQIYDAQLTLADALIDYNNPNDLVFNKGGSVALANLKGYWALSEGSGSIAYDSSGQGNNGTITGATYDDKQPTIPQLGMVDWAKSTPVSTVVTLIEAPNDLGKDILGNALRLRDGGFNLDGSGYAEVADDSTVNPTAAMTLQCWIQSNTESNKGLVAKWTNAEKDYMLLKTTSKFKFYIGASNGESGTIPTSGWVNIAGTYDGANIKTYINGVLSTTTSTTGSIPNSTNTLDIGRYNNSQYYSERIDETMVYNRALTQKEIANNHKIGLSKHS